MDMMVGLSNIFQQFREEGIAIGNNVNLIVLEGQCHALVDKQVNQLALTFRHAEVFLFHKIQHRTLRQLIHRTLADHTFPTMIDAKEKIEDDTDNRHKEDNQCPCHRLGRLPVVHDDMNDSCCYQNPCQRYTYYI